MKIAPQAVALLVTMLAFPAFAQDANGLKRAGDQTKFRVIQRFEPPRTKQPHPFPTAKDAIDRGDWSAAWTAVEKLDAPGPVEQFLKGYVALQHQRPEALELLKASANHKHPLASYAARFGAQSALAQKKFEDALKLATMVESGLPISDDAQWLAVEALRGLNRPDEALVALGAWLEKHPKDARTPQARLDYARGLSATDPNLAAQQAIAVLRDTPLNGAATEARAFLDGIKKRLKPDLQKQSDPNNAELKMARWRAMYAAHRSEDVVGDISKVAAKLPENQWCEGHFLVAHSLTKLRKHADSVGWYAKVIDRCATEDWRLRSLYLGGKARWNAGQRPEARAWFERLWTEFPTHSYADDAMYFSARILEEDGSAKSAAELIKKQTSKYPDGDMAQDAHWLEVRRLFAQAKYAEAVKRIDQIGTLNEPDLYSRGRARYFRARALELDGKSGEARSGYEQVLKDYPMTYYAFLAFQRLGAKEKGQSLCAKIDACGVETTANPAIGLDGESEPGFVRAEELLALGLETLARAEVLALEGKWAARPDTLWVLADHLDKTGAFTLSHDIARRRIKGWDAAFPHPTARRYWEIAFPRPFQAQIDEWAPKHQVPTALVWAIMREESGFNPRIESWANARGLLQLMSATAERMAKLSGVTFSWDALFEPQTNIRLGTRYLQELGQAVGFHPLLMISGYNGGMGNVGRWFKEAKSTDIDLWVEDIPFGQTRNYTKRVLLSFWVYSWLYGDAPVPRISMEIPSQ